LGFAYEITVPVHPAVATYIDCLHGRLERLGFGRFEDAAQIARLKADLAAVRQERDRLGAERDQLNAECHRVTGIAERKILELHRTELACDELRRRNAGLIAQRDEAYARLEQFGAVLSAATFALNGGGT
jgi:hypothetical protein